MSNYHQLCSFHTKIILGTTTGQLILYETSRFAGAGQKFASLLSSQTSKVNAHGSAITAISINNSGNLIACYAPNELKLSFYSIESGSLLSGFTFAASNIMKRATEKVSDKNKDLISNTSAAVQLKLKQIVNVMPTGGLNQGNISRGRKKSESNENHRRSSNASENLHPERIVWINDKTAVLFSNDGSEFRFMV